MPRRPDPPRLWTVPAAISPRLAGLDIPWLEDEFRTWVEGREPPDDYAAAFYGFMKKKQEQQNQ